MRTETAPIPLRSQISIKIGSLETGEVKEDETTIFSMKA